MVIKVKYLPRRKWWMNAIVGIVSLVMGGLIYILCRGDSLLMFSWFDVIGLSGCISSSRSAVSPVISIIPKWVYFCLPNARWAFGGIFLLASIWKEPSTGFFAWISAFIAIAIGAEVCQLFMILPGTFDAIDILLMCLFIFLALMIIAKRNQIADGE